VKRLAPEFKSGPEEYDRIFFERAKNAPDQFDLDRWKTLVKYFGGGNIVDLGCLDSQIPRLIYEKIGHGEFWQYWGVDHALQAIEQMTKESQSNPWKTHTRYIENDVYKTAFLDGEMDYAVMGELLEHLERPEEAIKEAFRILVAGGILALSTPLEETEAGDVDKEHHMWSFSQEDIGGMCSPFGKQLEYGFMISKKDRPYYHPIQISFWKKHEQV
jgi:ubiquinone/menaquinone biosynthesis C-methylase UbiE